MPELVEQVDVDAPPEQVWAALADWDRQGEWMMLTDVQAVDGDGQGVGGRLAAVTGVKLPGGRQVGVLDTMLITAWESPAAGRRPAHRPGGPRHRHLRDPAPAAAARRSSGPRGWTCRSARWAGPAGRWCAR